VTQNLPVLAAQQLNPSTSQERVFTLASGPPAPVFPTPDATGRFPLPNGVFARALPEEMRLPTVDAWNFTYQRQLGDDYSAEVAYVGNKGTHVFVGGGPAFNLNDAAAGLPGTDSNLRKPFFSQFGWTQGIDFFCNCADNRYNALQAKLTKRFSRGWSLLTHYTLQRALNNEADEFLYNRELNRGRQDTDRTHVFVAAQTLELPFGRDRRFLSDVPRGVDWIVGGWQFNHNTTIQSGLPFNVSYNGCGRVIVDAPCFPDLIGDPDVSDPDQYQWFNTTPIGESGSAFGQPALGTVGNLGRNELNGPGYWRTDASLFKKFYFNENTHLEFRVEVGNLFNHVNLGQPDAGLGNATIGELNPNAGRITGVAYGSDTLRNFQWALRLQF